MHCVAQRLSLQHVVIHHLSLQSCSFGALTLFPPGAVLDKGKTTRKVTGSGKVWRVQLISTALNMASDVVITHEHACQAGGPLVSVLTAVS